jgi:hypothetical protein
MANAITKYTSESSFTTRILHLEGQEVLGSTKQKANITPRLEGDSHKHDGVNFFQLKVTQRLVALLIHMLMLGSPVGLLGMGHLFWLFKDWKFKSVCLGMVHGN